MYVCRGMGMEGRDKKRKGKMRSGKSGKRRKRRGFGCMFQLRKEKR